MADKTLLVLATQIISAHLSYNKVSSERLPELIGAVYSSLAGLGKASEPAPEARTPAVSVRASVKADAIVCLECGKRFKMLRRHLGADHQLTPDEYRMRWNLASDYPIVSPDYAEKRKNLAIASGLGSKGYKGGRPKAARPTFPSAEEGDGQNEAPAVPKLVGRNRKKLGIAAGE